MANAEKITKRSFKLLFLEYQEKRSKCESDFPNSLHSYGIFKLKDENNEENLFFTELFSIFKIPTKFIKNLKDYPLKEIDSIKADFLISLTKKDKFSLLKEKISINGLYNYLIQGNYFEKSHVAATPLNKLQSMIRNDFNGSMPADVYLSLVNNMELRESSGEYTYDSYLTKWVEYKLIKKDEVDLENKIANQFYFSLERGRYNFLKQLKGTIDLYKLKDSRLKESNIFKLAYNDTNINFDIITSLKYN